MHRQDFLQKNAETPLCEHYLAAGSVCRLTTNCEDLLQAARDTFLPVESRPDSVDFSLRFWVNGAGADSPQEGWPKPYVRGVDHLIFAGFDANSSLLADLRTRRVIGRFSAAMARDARHWRTVIFPMLLSIMAGSAGLIELHASCVAKNDGGLILAGPSRSGKSTLAMAFKVAGFRLLSDDRTFCSLERGKLQAWGLPRPLKLRPEAASWFDGFRDREPTDIQNGERVFHFEARETETPKCVPQLLVFLEKHEGTEFCMMPMAAGEARSHIEAELLAETPETIRKQTEVVEQVLLLPRYRLRYGGRPQEIAREIAASFLNAAGHPSLNGDKWRAS